MSLEYLKNWKGPVTINGTKYKSIAEASKINFDGFSNNVCIILHSNENTQKLMYPEASESVFKITVKSYMTKHATPEFDFMAKWNNDNPMPLRTMVGTVEKETRGMVYMNLHGDLTSKVVTHCLKCGRPITNPVSQYFGLGPECGNHNYVNPFETEEELKSAVEKYRREYLQNIKWSGWIIKSAILEQEEIDNE